MPEVLRPFCTENRVDINLSLANKTLLGIAWNFTEQFSRRGVGLLTTFVLAYFLTPADFGLVAMMAVFIALASSLMDMGFKQALIRLKQAGQEDFDTAFYANILLGLLSYLLLFSCAPWIAVFYEEPQLTSLIRIAGLVVLIHAFQIVQSAILSRALNFKAQFKASLPAALVSSLVALLLAYQGAGVWALVVQVLVAELLIAVILWRQAAWRPAAGFNRVSLSSMYAFGYKLFLAGLLDTVFKNIYILVISKLFTASAAGLYFFAEKIKDLVLSQLVGSIQTVTYPALSTLQDDDAQLKLSYRSLIGVTSFLLSPALIFLAALAEPLFQLLLPEKWWPAAAYLQLMCLAALLYPLHAINLNILQVKGRSDLFLYLELMKKAIVVVVLLVSVQFGVLGILVGQLVSSILCYLPNSYYSVQLIGYSVAEQLADFLPGMLLAGLIGAGIYAATLLWDTGPLLILILSGGSGVVLYCLGAGLLKLQAWDSILTYTVHRFGKSSNV